MEDEEYNYKREATFVQTEIDFHNDEDFGELFRKEAKIIVTIKKEEHEKIS